MVLRFEGLYPHQLAGYELHRKRRGGDLGHVDPARSRLNRPLEIKGAVRQMLQPSIHPLIEDYEAAQDSVGQSFAKVGLTRGERRAAAIRAARVNAEVPPPRCQHVRTRRWRETQELALADREWKLDRREDTLVEREAEADAILAVATGIGAGLVAVEDSTEHRLVPTQAGEASEAFADIERAVVAIMFLLHNLSAYNVPRASALRSRGTRLTSDFRGAASVQGDDVSCRQTDLNR